jgi:soluble lytic murein transglycosylase-like protein
MTGKRQPGNKSMPKARRLRIILVGLLLFCSGSAAMKAETREVYFFRDNKGVMHFTDAPTDQRFRPFKVRAQVFVGMGSSRVNPGVLKPYILFAADKYQLDPALIMAVIRVESAFDQYAVSWAGAQGLMQLMPGTAQMMQVANVFDPFENILGGTRYLRSMMDRFKDVNLALAAYNCGPERVARENGIPPIKETQAYVNLVLRYYQTYKESL